MLKNPEVIALRSKLLKALKDDPPFTGFLPGLFFTIWLARRLVPVETALILRIEEALGNEGLSLWLIELVDESGVAEKN